MSAPACLLQLGCSLNVPVGKGSWQGVGGGRLLCIRFWLSFGEADGFHHVWAMHFWIKTHYKDVSCMLSRSVRADGLHQLSVISRKESMNKIKLALLQNLIRNRTATQESVSMSLFCSPVISVMGNVLALLFRLGGFHACILGCHRFDTSANWFVLQNILADYGILQCLCLLCCS